MTFTTAELDRRESNGIAVTLLWDRQTNDLTVHVVDTAQGEEFELSCPVDQALDCFHHPYVYATPERLRFHAVSTDARAY